MLTPTKCIYCPPKTTDPYDESSDLQNSYAQIMGISNPVEKWFHFNNLVRQLVLWENEGAAIDILEEWDTLPNKKILVAAYLGNKNYSASRAVLNQIPQDNEEDGKFYQLYDVLLDIGEDSRDIQDITEEEKQVVVNVAGSPTEVSVNAEAVLAMIDGVSYNREPQKYVEPESKRLTQKDESTPDMAIIPSFIVIPNPAKNTANIQYRLPADFSDAQIAVFDITGRKLKTYILDEDINEIAVQTSEYFNGIYIYSLIVDNRQIMNKRIAVIK